MIHIAVLMTCHNRKVQTLHCLQNLFSQQGLHHSFTLRTYLVDDGSTDGTGEAVCKNYPQVRVINGNGELYWNRGMYTAWKVAAADKCDSYLWLNDDTELYPDAIKQMLLAASLTNYKSIICGSIESPTNKGELTYGGGSSRNNSYVGNYPNGEIEACNIINGNCVLIPYEVFLAVGNLDWRFIHAIGDNDYGLRAHKKGILSYSTGVFVASCAKNETPPKWCMPETNFIDRIKNLYSPLGYSHPVEFFIYEKRHFGLLIALKHYCSIHLRLFIPKLWK
ncbi:glycosyltransferase family 2 protein [Dyadobacter sp. CY323]|uniref:glycosyltransferase family 2 protein n=1 Tax=Dyadobacter sp. CY323 TaxID=2907302 RepID=UPI001F34B12F|nr:glycosyltransferase family 2 protein [Dyadobacter sp. CY323]MCE6991389.1 glycosyltransferase family 2 protein [Dyadobacter sp. CY323]